MATHNMTLPVEFSIRSTLSWHGKYDKNGNMLDEIRYGGSARVFGTLIAETIAIYKTEAAAIKALKDDIKRS